MIIDVSVFDIVKGLRYSVNICKKLTYTWKVDSAISIPINEWHAQLSEYAG